MIYAPSGQCWIFITVDLDQISNFEGDIGPKLASIKNYGTFSVRMFTCAPEVGTIFTIVHMYVYVNT